MDVIQAGTLVEGRYAIGAEVGRGGAAVVYRCRHVTLGTEHAIKVAHDCSPRLAQRILVEGRAQARLLHPNVVRVTDCCQHDGSPALVMELVRGPSLSTLLDRMRLTQAQVDHLALGIFNGADAAHALGIIHRDLKPANILVDVVHGLPIPKLADFGLVKSLLPSGSDGPRTRPGSTLGTPEYMAPEQMRSAPDADRRADVFSLGVVLYELVTGVGCFHTGDLLETSNRIAQGTYRPIEELVPDAPLRVRRAIAAALEPNRAKRCQTVADLAALWFEGARVPSDSAWNDPSYAAAVAPWIEGVSDVVPSIRPRTPATLPLASVAASADPVRAVTQLRPSPPPVRRRAWLAAGALTCAFGVNAGAVGIALALGFQGQEPAPPPTPAASVELVSAAPAPVERSSEAKRPSALPDEDRKPSLFKRLLDPQHARADRRPSRVKPTKADAR